MPPSYQTSLPCTPATSFIISFDCELTGPMLMQNAMVNLGAVFMDVNTCETLDKFGCYINMPEDRHWDTCTVNNFWLKDPERIRVMDIISKSQGMEIPEAMKFFASFLSDCKTRAGGNNIQIITNRVDIDVGWVDMYLSMAGYLPLRYFLGEPSSVLPECGRVLDANSFYQGICGLSHERVENFNTSHPNKRFNFGVAASKYLRLTDRAATLISHDAIDDAEHVGQVHCYVLQKLNLTKTKKRPSRKKLL